jgi:DNA replication protein DnaC
MPNELSLPLLLKQLGLPMMYRHYQEQAEIAQDKHWSYSHYLSVLSDLEVAARCQKRIQRHLKESKLPPAKTLDNFDFKAAKSINAAQIQALAQNPEWVKQARNIVIFGPSGVGKSHLAAAIACRLIEQGIRALYSPTTTLVQKLQQARAEYKLPEMLAKLARFPLLILDDISYVKKSEMETSVLFELIADRYETNSLIITSNQPFAEWDQIFPDSTMAVAAIDRLIHHATIINVQEDSYRKTQAQKK